MARSRSGSNDRLTSARPLEFCQRLEGRRLLADFDIQLVFSLDFEDPAQKVAIEQAAARWESILLEDIPDVGPGAWGQPVDDIRINVNLFDIDGTGGVLGYAESRYSRNNNTGLPINGILVVDVDDVTNPGLLDIATHEMGHLLGIGSLWSGFNLVANGGSTNPTYTGAAAIDEYVKLKTGATSIPVENTGGLGTRDVHWRETTFDKELMTGYYDGGFSNPLSRVSAASLIDLGYPGVNLDAAQAYNLPGGNAIPTIFSLTGSTPVSGTLVLTANGVNDTVGVSNVRFYRETSGVPGLQASGNVISKDLLISTDTSGPDWSTSVALSSLEPGTYTFYAQVTDSSGAVSATVSFGYTVIPAPIVPDAPTLSAASDSGASNSDRITNVVLPTINGTSTNAAGVTIEVFADGVSIGTTTTQAGGGWTFTPAAPLAPGVRSITATASDGGATSAASLPLSITIDTVAPQVTASSFEYLTLLGVRFTFDEDISGSIDSGDLTFQNTTNATPYAATLHTYASNVATFKFAVFPPPKGDYIATLTVSGITDVAGNALTATPDVPFFYLPGDVNRSRSVNFNDLLIIAQHYGQTGDASVGDINYSGTVEFNDLLLLAKNYNAALLQSVAKAPSPAVKRSKAGVLPA